MKVIDPGHRYLVDNYDSDDHQKIVFMKREGEGYPGNVGHYPGTNCQELIRVLIDRIQYLDKQFHHANNEASISHLRAALWLFEDRAAERHGFADHEFEFRLEDIEQEPTCRTCGHVICKGH